MPISATADAILLAIQTARRLSHGLRQAYVNSIRSQRLLLPLPAFDQAPTLLSANRFFAGEGATYLDQVEHLQRLHERHQIAQLTGEEAEEYTQYYVTFFGLQRYGHDPAQLEEHALQPLDVINLLRIRQWERGKQPQPSALQVAAGTLVETGIDFFLLRPEALRSETPMGKALRTLLHALDDVSLIDTPLAEAAARELLPALLVGAAEGLAELGPALTDDPALVDFIATTANRLASDLLQQQNLSEEALRWGPILFNSIIRQAGHTLLDQSASLFRTDEGETALIQDTGRLILGLLLTDEGISWSTLYSVPALDQLTRTVLQVVNRYPELVSKKEALQAITVDLSKALADSGIRRPGFFPYLLRMLLEATAQNLSLFWAENEREEKKLLIALVREVLRSVARTDPEGNWSFKWTDQELLTLLNQLLDIAAAHPELIVRKIGEKPLLILVVGVILDEITQPEHNHRWTAQHVLTIIHSVSQAILSVPALFDQSEDWLHTFLKLLIDRLFNPDRPVRESLSDSLKLVFRNLAPLYPNQYFLVFLDIVLSDFLPLVRQTPGDNLVDLLERIDDIIRIFPAWENGQSIFIDLFRELENVLAPILAERADAGASLLEIILDLINEQLDQLSPDLEADLGQPLRQATRQIAQAWPSPNQMHSWWLQLSTHNLVELMGFVFTRSIREPELLLDDRLKNLLLTYSAALDDFDHRRHLPLPIHADLLSVLFELVLADVGWTKTLNVREEQEVWALHYALEWFMAIIFRQDARVRQFVSRPDLFEQMAQAFFRKCELEGLTEKGIDRAALHMNELLLGVAEEDISETEFISAIWFNELP